MLYSHLQYRRFDGGAPRLIDGKTLLFQLQRTVDQAYRGGVRGSGATNDPWRLNSASAWLGCADRLTRDHHGDAFLTMGGRMLKKNARVYVSDEGPVWRYLQGQGAETPGSSKAYGGEAPTYQMAAQRVTRPHEVFPRSADEGVRAAGWNTVAHTPMLVRTMRHLLKHQEIPLLEGDRVSKHYARLQHSLPVLTGAMFLAEPARNLRAFPQNLMLLDLAERGVPLVQTEGSFYTVDRILWHPDALDMSQTRVVPESALPPQHPVQGPVGERRAIEQVLRRDQLHHVGGEMPSSPTRGGEIGGGKFPRVGAMPDQSRIPESKRAVAREGWLRGQLAFQNFDYIHRKEISVVVRWLSALCPYTFKAVTAEQFSGATVEVLRDLDVMFFEDARTALDMRHVQTLFRLRLGSLDLM